VLRAAGIVDAERDGREVRYRLTDPDVTVACGLMRGVLERRLTRLGEMAATSSAAAGRDASSPSEPIPTEAPASVSPPSAPIAVPSVTR
jgi:hypothetical protein